MSNLEARLAALRSAHAQDPDASGPAAVARRAEVLALQTSQALTTPEAQAAAAEILLGSEIAAEVELAQTLALVAMGKLRAARPLAAAAYDRLRRFAGAPQKFGTQTVVCGGRRELWPVDPATTDSERAKWGLPALAELRRRAAAPAT